MRIKGWMGRADQTTKVRGMFVHASQVAEVVARHPEVGRARLVVSGEMTDDHLLLRAEVQSAHEGLATRLAESIRDITRLRSAVDLVPPGTLPNDGRVIEDARTYR
jgi:phenylacetate-CoA ligase